MLRHANRVTPVILHDYPASQSALARIRPSDPPLAERFELYARGIELANGYHELLDPAVLRERNRDNNSLRTFSSCCSITWSSTKFMDLN